MDTLLSWTMIIMAFSCVFSTAFIGDNDVRRLQIKVSSDVPNKESVTVSFLGSVLGSSPRFPGAGKGMGVLPSERHENDFNSSNHKVFRELQRPNIEINPRNDKVLDFSDNTEADAQEFNDRFVAEAINLVPFDKKDYDDSSEAFLHSVAQPSRNIPSQRNDYSQPLYQLNDNKRLHNSPDARNDDLSHPTDRYNSPDYDYDLENAGFHLPTHNHNEGLSGSHKESESSEISTFVGNRDSAAHVIFPTKAIDFFSEFRQAVATGLTSLIIKPFTSVVKPFLVTPLKMFLKPMMSQYRTRNPISFSPKFYTDCCETCVDGDVRCRNRCHESNCMPTEQCSAAGEGAYAAYCQKKCAKGMISGQSVLPDFIPIEACRGLCAADVQKLCKQQSCVDFGCYMEECESVAPAGCG